MLTPHPYDHNQPVIIESKDDLPPGLPSMHFFKMDIEAMHKAIMKMSLELGGFYMRALISMYREMQPLPAEDDKARALLGIDVRTYRRLKKQLLEIPGCLIEKPSGRISNNRFEEEITAFVVEFRNRRDAAIEREKKRRKNNVQGTDPTDFRPTSAELPADFRPTSAELPADLRAISGELPSDLASNLSEKRNEINVTATTRPHQKNHNSGTTVVPHARVIRVRTRVRVREEEGRKVESPPSAGAHASGGEVAEAPSLPWRVGNDGSFSGRVVGHIPAGDMDSMRRAYPALEFPAVLIEVEDLIRADAERLKAAPGSPMLVRRVTAFLGKKQIEFAELRKKVFSKSVSDSDECCWDEARIVVAGNLRDELLSLVQGNEDRLRDTLDKAAVNIGIELRGSALVKAVRGNFKRNLDWDRRDERKAAAVERRASGNSAAATSPDAKPVETRAQRLARLAGESMDRMGTRR